MNIISMILWATVILCFSIIGIYLLKKVNYREEQYLREQNRKEKFKNMIITSFKFLFHTKNYKCTFNRLNGISLTLYVDSEDEFKKYKNWYLGDSEEKIICSENIMYRLTHSQLESFEYKKITAFSVVIEKLIVNIRSQPSLLGLNFKSFIKLYIAFVFSISSYYYFNSNFVLSGAGSIEIFNKILLYSESGILLFIIFYLIVVIISIIITLRWPLNQTNTKHKNISNQNIGMELINLIAFAIAYKFIINPILISDLAEVILEVLQSNGYFLI